MIHLIVFFWWVCLCYSVLEWNLCQLKRSFWSRSGFFIRSFFSETYFLRLLVNVETLDKYNRELFYKDIKSNAIMVSYDCCIPSVKWFTLSLVCWLTNISVRSGVFFFIRSNYQLKSSQTLYALGGEQTMTESFQLHTFDSSKSIQCTQNERKNRKAKIWKEHEECENEDNNFTGASLTNCS